MKKIMCVIFGLIFIGTMLSYASSTKIQILTKDVDVGEMDKGKNFDYKIEIKNIGKEDLVIENVYSSCGCLEVMDKRWPNMQSAENIKVEPVIIKPDHSIYITAKLDTNKVFGQFEKMLHVISNDHDNKDAMWKIKGNVVAASYVVSSATSASQGGVAIAQDVIMVKVFYSPGCMECKEIMNDFLPNIKEKYGNKISIVDYNIDSPESFAFLLDLQNKYDERAKKGGFFNPKPPAVFVNSKLLYGVKEIKERLENEIK